MEYTLWKFKSLRPGSHVSNMFKLYLADNWVYAFLNAQCFAQQPTAPMKLPNHERHKDFSSCTGCAWICNCRRDMASFATPPVWLKFT